MRVFLPRAAHTEAAIAPVWRRCVFVQQEAEGEKDNLINRLYVFMLINSIIYFLYSINS